METEHTNNAERAEQVDTNPDAESDEEYERRRKELGPGGFGLLHDLLVPSTSTRRAYNRIQRERAKYLEKFQLPEPTYEPSTTTFSFDYVRNLHGTIRTLQQEQEQDRAELRELREMPAQTNQQKRVERMPVDYEKLEKVYSRVVKMSQVPLPNLTAGTPREAESLDIWNDEDDTLGPWFDEAETMITKMMKAFDNFVDDTMEESESSSQ